MKPLENGSITLSTPVDISDYPYKLTTNSEASNVPMEARNYTVETTARSNPSI